MKSVYSAVRTGPLNKAEVTVKQGNITGQSLHARKGRDIFRFEGISFAKPLVEDLKFLVRKKMS